MFDADEEMRRSQYILGTIAYVWSFREDADQDIPYRIDLWPGAKPRMTCTCPSFVNRGRHTCKHLVTLREEARNGLLLFNQKFQVTDFGKTHLKLTK